MNDTRLYWWTTDFRSAHLRNKREPRALCGEKMHDARPADSVRKCEHCLKAQELMREVA